MKIKSNRNILKARIRDAEKCLEAYEMEKKLLYMVEDKAFKINKPHIASLARTMAQGAEASATWKRGMIAGYNVSLMLIK